MPGVVKQNYIVFASLVAQVGTVYCCLDEVHFFPEWQVFVKAKYEQQGIKVEVVSPQNEPNYEQNYPSCRWNAQQFTKFLPFLDKALKGANLKTDIMLGTMSNPQGDLQIIQAVAGNPRLKVVASKISKCSELPALVAGAEAIYHLAAAVGVVWPLH